MIREHRSRKGVVTYGVRLYGENGWYWIGTYPSRQLAEDAERAATRRPRPCVSCGRRFRPRDDRRIRCDACVRRSQAHLNPADDHWLYRCFNAEGELLYIGITSSGVKRFRRHGNEKSWWREIATITLEHFDLKQEVAEAEREAIRAERPARNRDLTGVES